MPQTNSKNKQKRNKNYKSNFPILKQPTKTNKKQYKDKKIA
jgi:hypothetical protein